MQNLIENIPVSVIITTFNDAVYLKNSLVSVLNQSKQPAEIIVVDDGSDDNLSEKIVNQFKKNFTNLFFIKKINGGPSSARNLGLNSSKYEFICFFDVDDFMIYDNLETKYNILINLDLKNYFGVFGNAEYRFNKKKLTFNDCNGFLDIDSIGRENGACGSSPCYLFNKQLIKKVNGFDENLINNEDFDLIIRLLKKGYKCYGSTKAGTIINIRDGSVSRNKNFKKIYLNTKKFLKKAKKENYFSMNEMNKRFKENELFFAKKIFFHEFFSKNFIISIKKAFSYQKPSRFKELFLYYLFFFVE